MGAGRGEQEKKQTKKNGICDAIGTIKKGATLYRVVRKDTSDKTILEKNSEQGCRLLPLGISENSCAVLV